MNGRTRLSWEETAIRLAFDIAEYRSEDPYTRVGAVVIKKDNSIIMGYNGAPKGMVIDWSDRDERRRRVFHAEFNVLKRVLPGEAKLMAVTHLPCEECLKDIKSSELTQVYYSIVLPNYDPSFVFTLAEEYGIVLTKIDVDRQSINKT